MATQAPSTQKAWQYSSTTGGIEKNLKLNPSAPTPTPTQNQHLVQVIATALNPIDYKPGSIPIIGRLIRPRIATPCSDIAGRLVTPATGSSLKPGQLVFGAAGKNPIAGGALAEYAFCQRDHLIAIPEGVKPTDAASVPVAGLTAYQSIAARVKEGDRIFINGGSGGTGVFGIQVAKAAGCHVTTSCSTPNVELCKSLGADEVIDYREQNLIETLASKEFKFDHVVDNVGVDGKLYWACHRFTKPEAEYVMVGGSISWAFAVNLLKIKLLPRFLGGGQRKYTGFFTKASTHDLEQVAKWITEGKVRPVIDHEFTFEEAPAAFERLRTGRARGKIVIAVNSTL
jgi:NADPH:quinone reductase-like Zn-dependent oxidoreductase